MTLQRDLEALLRRVRRTYKQDHLKETIDVLPKIKGGNPVENISLVIEKMDVYAEYHNLRDPLERLLKTDLFYGVAGLAFQSQNPDLIQQIMRKTFESEERGANDYKHGLFLKAIKEYGDTEQGRLIVENLAVGVSRSDYAFAFIKDLGEADLWCEKSIVEGLCKGGDRLSSIVYLRKTSKTDVFAYFADYITADSGQMVTDLVASLRSVYLARHYISQLVIDLINAGLESLLPAVEEQLTSDEEIKYFVEGVLNSDKPFIGNKVIAELTPKQRDSFRIVGAIVESNYTDLESIARVYAADNSQKLYFEVIRKRELVTSYLKDEVVAFLVGREYIYNDGVRYIAKKTIDPDNTEILDKINSVLPPEEEMSTFSFKLFCDGLRKSKKCNDVYNNLVGKVDGWK